VSVIGHTDRADPLRDYCMGLVMPGERKSAKPMAAITAPGRRRPSISRCCLAYRANTAGSRAINGYGG
jgi:SRSO17 transposase